MTPARFSRETACAILGIPTSALAEWDLRAPRARDGQDNGLLALSDLVALAVAREAARRLGPRFADFAPGVKQLFPVLASRPDLERADDLSAVVGHGFAFLWRVQDGEACRPARDIVVLPLRPLLHELRDRVFP